MYLIEGLSAIQADKVNSNFIFLPAIVKSKGDQFVSLTPQTSSGVLACMKEDTDVHMCMWATFYAHDFTHYD